MPEKIITIQEKIAELKNDSNCKTLKKVSFLAVELILSAIEHDRWNDFANYFIDEKNSPLIKQKQLARLRLEDDKGGDVYIRRTVGYLLANSMCGCHTKANLDFGIENRLDADIRTLTVRDLELDLKAERDNAKSSKKSKKK